MTSQLLQDDGWYCLKSDVHAGDVAELVAVGRVDKLSLTEIDLVTVRHVTRLKALRSIERLWLWYDVTRRAMNHIVQLPGLRVIDVLNIVGPGSMERFGSARSLTTVRANHHLREDDLLRISCCHSLEELGAQSCLLTHRALDALLCLPRLRSLDLEATRFDNAMAKRVSRSETLVSLDVGGTLITGEGLRHLVRIGSLRSLDLWATCVSLDDMRMLLDLPSLEYLSVGGYEGSGSLESRGLVPLLLEMPALKRVWLDGVDLLPEQRAALEAKLESVRIT